MFAPFVSEQRHTVPKGKKPMLFLHPTGAVTMHVNTGCP